MNYFSTDALMVYGFLLLTLLVGLWAGRNVKTIQEYAIANRVYGTGVLVMAFLSTYIECWNLIGFPGDIFADGITHLIPSVLFGIIFCLLFIAKFIAPKMIYFQGCLTMGELMGKFYGKFGRVATGFLGLIYNITAVSIQIIFFKIACTLLGINGNLGVAIGAFILVLYASLGGIKAVTITGVIQFIVIAVALSIMLNMVLDQVGGFKQLITRLPAEKLQLFKFDKEKMGEFGAGYYSFPILAIWFLFPGFPLSFPFIQRMLMAKDNRQLISMYYWSTAFLVIFFLVLTFIGLGMFVLYPNLESGQVIPYLIQMLPASWLKGIALIGLIAVIMSTADAFLHSAGLLFVHDVIKPIVEKHGIEINELKAVKYFTLLVGCISIVISLMAKNIFNIAVYGMDLSALIFTIPLIAGIMGLKTDARSFYISSITTILSFFFAKFFLPNLYFIPFAILMNALSFFSAHYVRNKGFRITQHLEAFVAIDTKWRVSSQTIGVLLSMPLQWAKNFMQAFTSAIPNLYLFAVLTIINHLVSLLIYTPPDLTNYIWSISINTLGVLFCLIFLVKDYWPQRLQKHLGAYWLLVLLYCLPFSATANFLLGGSDIKGVVQVALSTTMLIFLVDWTSFFVLAASGMVVACLIYRYGTSYASLVIPYQAQYLLAYALLFLVIFGKLFLRKPAMTSTARDLIISQRIKNTFLGEQIALVNNAVQGLAKLIHRYMQHTEEIWMDRRDGFQTLFVNDMQTIEDPDLYQLLVEILPAFQGIENDGKFAMRLLKDAISSRLMATSLELHTVKVCIKNAVFELRINRSSPHGYMCTLYQIVKDFHSKKAELRVVTFAPTKGHLHIRDYSHAIPTDRTLPLLKFLSTTDSRDLSISNTEAFLKSLQQSIADIKQGYKEYTLEFPNLELVA